MLSVDDLVDTGRYPAKGVREIVPRAHLATVYAKPMGRPLARDGFITEVSAPHLDLFPWGYRARLPGRRSTRRADSRCRDAGF